MNEAATLRRLQMIVTQYLTHEMEAPAAMELVIEQLEKAGFGSVESVEDVTEE